MGKTTCGTEQELSSQESCAREVTTCASGLKVESIRDSSPLLSTAYMMETWKKELARAKRDQPFASSCGIDHFKEFNDNSDIGRDLI
jgi:hypothetical protein